METIEYRSMDKTSWGPGPWETEPDKKQWEDEETGLPCLIVRAQAGHLCGYVGVSEDHPAFGVYYDDYPGLGMDVHGELNFSGLCQEGLENSEICHKTAPGEPDRVWWLGFHCAHCGDRSPQTESLCLEYGVTGYLDFIKGGQHYRTFAYVAKEVRSLARQLKTMHVR